MSAKKKRGRAGTPRRSPWNKGRGKFGDRFVATRLPVEVWQAVGDLIAEDGGRLPQAEILRMAIEDGLPITAKRLKALRGTKSA